MELSRGFSSSRFAGCPSLGLIYGFFKEISRVPYNECTGLDDWLCKAGKWLIGSFFWHVLKQPLKAYSRNHNFHDVNWLAGLVMMSKLRINKSHKTNYNVKCGFELKHTTMSIRQCQHRPQVSNCRICSFNQIHSAITCMASVNGPLMRRREK